MYVKLSNVIHILKKESGNSYPVSEIISIKHSINITKNNFTLKIFGNHYQSVGYVIFSNT